MHFKFSNDRYAPRNAKCSILHIENLTINEIFSNSKLYLYITCITLMFHDIYTVY